MLTLLKDLGSVVNDNLESSKAKGGRRWFAILMSVLFWLLTSWILNDANSMMDLYPYQASLIKVLVFMILVIPNILWDIMIIGNILVKIINWIESKIKGGEK